MHSYAGEPPTKNLTLCHILPIVERLGKHWVLDLVCFGFMVHQPLKVIQKLILDASLLNTKHYKVQLKGKVE